MEDLPAGLARHIARLADHAARRVGAELDATDDPGRTIALLVVADRVRHLAEHAAKLTDALEALTR